MRPDASAILCQVTSEVLEDVCFLLPVKVRSHRDSSLQASVSVGFSGRASGVLHLQARGDVLGEIARNMLGADVAVSAEDRRDAFAELGNIICGNVLPKLAGTDAVFDVGVPRMEEGGAIADPHAAASVEVESGTIAAQLQLLAGELSP